MNFNLKKKQKLKKINKKQGINLFFVEFETQLTYFILMVIKSVKLYSEQHVA